MQQLLECPVCTLQFDSSDHMPHLLPTCGHSLCRSCLQITLSHLTDENHFITCPDDQIQCAAGRDLKSYPVNQTILKILNKKINESNSQDQICPIHHRKLELICYDDQQQICANCALFGIHKQHHYKSLEEVVTETEKQVTETIIVFEEMKQKISSLRDKTIIAKIKEQFQKTVQNTFSQIEETCKEIIARILARQERIKEEAFQKIKLLEEKFLKKQSQAFSQVLEKADLWVISAEAKLVQFTQKTENGFLSYDLVDHKYTNSNMTQMGKQIMNELENCFQHYKVKLEEIPFKFYQIQGPIIQELSVNLQLVDYKKNNNSILMQSILDEPNILKDQSMIFDMNTEFSDFHSEQYQPSPLHLPVLSQPVINSGRSSRILKLNDKMEMLSNDSLEALDLSQSVQKRKEISEDAAAQIAEKLLRTKHLKQVNLMRNKINDEGAFKIMRSLIQCNVVSINFSQNLITDKIFDFMISLAKNTNIKIQKSINLNQNLINVTRNKKKIEELKKYGLLVTI